MPQGMGWHDVARHGTLTQAQLQKEEEDAARQRMELEASREDRGGPRWTAVDRGGPETPHFLTRGLKRISIRIDSHGLGLFVF